MLTHEQYMDRANNIRRRHRDKLAALYNVYAEKRSAVIAEYKAQMAALDEERKAPKEEESE